jgi:hypothetical protein
MQFVSSTFCIIAIVWIVVVVIATIIGWVVKKIKEPKLKDILIEVEKSKDKGIEYFDKLSQMGIKSSGELLERGASPEGRKEIVNTTGISGSLILEWICISDLIRIRGINLEHIHLLKEANINSVAELSQRNPEVFQNILIGINDRIKILSKPLTVSMVRDWIEQAKKLPQIIKY